MGSGGVACGAIEQEVFKNPCTSPDGTFTIYLYDINPAYGNKDGKRSTSNKTAFEWAKNRGTKVQGLHLTFRNPRRYPYSDSQRHRRFRDRHLKQVKCFLTPSDPVFASQDTLIFSSANSILSRLGKKTMLYMSIDSCFFRKTGIVLNQATGLPVGVLCRMRSPC